jgi:spermidine synthase
MDQPAIKPQWVIETFEDQLQFGFQRSEILFSDQSAFQTVEVIQTPTHGRILLNDGCFMISERDEHIYHEMMAHVPMFLHAKPKHILILGGGDGGTAREVLRHSSVEKCVLVEMDETVIKACKEFLPQTASAFSSPRLKTCIDDPLAWVERAATGGIVSAAEELKGLEHFDVILVDSTDPAGFIEPLYGEGFYAHLKKILAPNGIIVSQAESPFYAERMQKALGQALKKNFKRVHFFNFTNLTYPGGLWSMSFASDGIHPLDDLSPSRVAASGLTFKWYNQGIHEGSFLLPEFQKQNLREILNPL